MSITIHVQRRGSALSRCRLAGRCGVTLAAACITWITTRAPPRGRGRTRSAWRGSSTGEGSAVTWSLRVTSGSCTPRRSPRTRPVNWLITMSNKYQVLLLSHLSITTKPILWVEYFTVSF